MFDKNVLILLDERKLNYVSLLLIETTNHFIVSYEKNLLINSFICKGR